MTTVATRPICTPTQLEVLNDLEPVVDELIAAHEEKRQLWFSSDFLPCSENTDDADFIRDLRKRAKQIPDQARVALALNLMTEEGLPHFHRLLAVAFGNDTFWSKWNFLWTAEEDRHGNVMRDYCRESRLFDFNALERQQFEYIRNGFTPAWGGDPYKTFAYTSAQERATQISHESTGKLIGETEPVISGILRRIAGEEARHFVFYMTVFKEILKRDTNRALQAASEVLPAIDMPGVSMTNFADYAEVLMRSGVYSADDYKLIVEQLISNWKVDAMTGLNDMGEKAQEKIMSIPKRLEKISHYIERRMTCKSFNFDVVFGRKLAF
ncbi:MAG: acyl-ACP desaturase [Rhizobacter sp.]|nr:acyl-ACP desaturase [Chlorobiales bacterium]